MGACSVFQDRLEETLPELQPLWHSSSGCLTHWGSLPSLPSVGQAFLYFLNGLALPKPLECTAYSVALQWQHTASCYQLASLGLKLAPSLPVL